MRLATDFRRAYTAALRAYLDDGDERARWAAYELGRDAVAGGLGVLDIADAHHEALLAALGDGADPGPATAAAGEFFLESLSAFEMVQRGRGEEREEAEFERRHAAMVRQLSSFLADASLAGSDADSTHEILHLVAEQARELVGGACCVATLSPGDRGQPARAASFEEGEASWAARLALADLSSPDPPAGDAAPYGAWLAAPLTALDGTAIGSIHVFERQRRAFTSGDEAVLVHLAQMAAAAIERVRLYRHPGARTSPSRGGRAGRPRAPRA